MKGEITMELKDKVLYLVDTSGKTYHAISKELGLSHTTLYHLMAGNSKDMRLSTAFKLADYFNIDVNEFRENGN
jgi:DNA-binding XRE family transcriptional regulator